MRVFQKLLNLNYYENTKKTNNRNYIKEILRNTRRICSSKQKTQFVMEALRAEMSIEELFRK